MMNHIPDVAKAVVIKDFYHESNDSAFVWAILQKALLRGGRLHHTDEQTRYIIGQPKPVPLASKKEGNQELDKH